MRGPLVSCGTAERAAAPPYRPLLDLLDVRDALRPRLVGCLLALLDAAEAVADGHAHVALLGAEVLRLEAARRVGVDLADRRVTEERLGEALDRRVVVERGDRGER